MVILCDAPKSAEEDRDHSSGADGGDGKGNTVAGVSAGAGAGTWSARSERPPDIGNGSFESFGWSHDRALCESSCSVSWYVGISAAARFFGRGPDCLSFPEEGAWALTLVESDSQLVARAQSGDQQAFAELVRRHSALVFRVAVSILGREFISEAEDVVQEVFLKVHHAIESFRCEAAFSSWIYRITFNQAVNLKARVRFRSSHADETVLHRAVTPEPGLDRQRLKQRSAIKP